MSKSKTAGSTATRAPASRAERRAVVVVSQGNLEAWATQRRLYLGDRAQGYGVPLPRDWAELRDQLRDFAGTFPTPEEYRQFYMDHYAESVLHLGGATAAICAKCGKPLVKPTLKDRRFCSERCAAAVRMTGRNRTAAAAQRHFATCPRCLAGRPCKKLETFASTRSRRSDVLTRRTVPYRDG